MALEQRAASLSDNFSFNRIQSWLITFVVFLNLSALYQEFAPWFYLLAFICFSWRINTLVTTVNKPNKKGTKFLQSGLAIAGCLLLAVNAPTLGLLASMIHLLSFSYLMKMLEQNKPKDFFQLFCLGLFVLASSLIFDQGLALFSFFALTFILNLTVLLHYYCARFTLAQSYKKSAIMVLQSVPLAVCLFLFFPKLSPLWQMPSTQSAKTGLSDNVSVGDIADLALSNELAFRVNFTEKPPDYAQLYWRALTLANFDGKTWTKYSNSTMAQYRQLVNNKPANNKPANDEPVKAQHKPLNENASPGVAPLVNNVSATRYQVITEPSFQHWLFALGVSKVNTSGITIKKDQTLYSQNQSTK